MQYILVFVFATIPWIEILVIIPIAIGVGLNPVGVGVVAFAGNLGSVVVLIAFHEQISRWFSRFRPSSDGEKSARYRRARRLWDRYGLPGVSFASPILTGVHIAALLALAVGSSKYAVVRWLSIAIATWSVVLVITSVYGLSVLGVG